MDRRTASNGVVFYASPLLEARGVPHGFSTRVGGLSPAPFDSLNLGNPNGCEIQDNYARIYENYKLLQAAIGIGAGHERCWVHQVHGPIVIDARRGQAFASGVKADAMVSDDPNRALSVRTADCVPILLASDDGRTVAAVHAGWRGVIAEAVIHAVKTMGNGGRIVAAIGPCIGIDAFEVGPEVLEQFERSFGFEKVSRRRDDGKGQVDLRAGVRQQLLSIGVSEDRIELSDRCTARDADEFFSHRREHGVTGRMASIISARE
jgi:YfiH family protein